MSKKTKTKTEKKEKTILDELEKKDGKWCLPLQKPFKHGDREVSELLLDEPKAKHLRGLSGEPDMDEILIIVEKLAQEPTSIIDELSMPDTNRAVEYFSSFN